MLYFYCDIIIITIFIIIIVIIVIIIIIFTFTSLYTSKLSTLLTSHHFLTFFLSFFFPTGATAIGGMALLKPGNIVPTVSTYTHHTAYVQKKLSGVYFFLCIFIFFASIYFIICNIMSFRFFASPPVLLLSPILAAILSCLHIFLYHLLNIYVLLLRTTFFFIF